MMLVAVAPEQAYGPHSIQAAQTPPQATPPQAHRLKPRHHQRRRPRGARQAGPGQPIKLPPDLFKVPDGLEVTVWATSPLLHNPTNIDIDRDGRIWVAEGVRYRAHHARQPEGDRIVVLQDTDGDGKADSTHTFVQEPG